MIFPEMALGGAAAIVIPNSALVLLADIERPGPDVRFDPEWTLAHAGSRSTLLLTWFSRWFDLATPRNGAPMPRATGLGRQIGPRCQESL